MSTNQFSLLATRRFLPLFITQFLGAFNDNVFKNALVILITFRIAENGGYNPQILVTLAAGIFILPFFLFSATAGQLADKYERSRLISIIKFAEIVLMVLAVIGFYQQSVWLLMTVLFLLGAQATFFGPIKYAILPDHLHENELLGGNGLIEAGTFLAILTGTILGGLLILTSKGELFIATAILVISFSGWVSSWFIPKAGLVDPQLKVSLNFFKETYKIVQYSRQKWDVFLSILGISWFWLIGAVFLAEFSVFAKVILHANEQVVTLFFTLFSVGIGLGSLFCNKLLKGRVDASYVPFGALGMTLFTVDLYFASKHGVMLGGNELMGAAQFITHAANWRIMIDLLLIAISGGLYIVPLYAIVQTRSEAEHRARTIASNNIINAIFMVMAALATMVMLAMGFSVTQVFLTVAILNGLVAVYICKLLPEQLIKSSLGGLLKLFYRVEVIGLENYYQAGNRVVIIANHTSFLDAALLAAFLPDKLTFAINTFTAQQWWIKLFLRMVDTFPLNPTNPMAVKSLINYIGQDKKCVIFPEGRITMTGSLMKIYEGPGLIADKSGGKLLPIRIEGAQYTPFSRLRGKFRLQWFPKITLTIFPAQTFSVGAEYKGRQRRQQVSQSLYDLMTTMLFESSHYRLTLFQALLDAQATHGRSHSIIEDVERKPLSYRQLITRSFILGRAIAKTTQPQEYIGVLLPNMVSTAITFFAVQAFGRVPAMLNYSTGTRHVAMACKTALIKQVYSSRKFVQLGRLESMVAQLEQDGVKVIYLEDLSTTITGLAKLNGMLAALWPGLYYRYIAASKNYADANLPAVVLFTSGSEGTPKGVVLSHSNIQANRFQLSSRVDFTASDSVFNALPIFHSFGLTGGMLLPILSGMRTFFYPSPLHYRIVPELSYDTNATILFGTDTFLTGYAKYAHPYDFYSIRYVFAGAEKLKEETRKVWAEKFGVRIFEGYGATETSPVLAINTPMHNQPSSVGRLLPGIHYQLKPVPGIVEGGVLQVSGPNIMAGYLRAEDPGVLIPPENGWYDTGDVVSIDQLGYVTIKGRVKRFAKIAGEMVSLTEAENTISKLWPAHQHAIISIPDAKKGEQLILVTNYADADRGSLIAFAQANGIGEINIPKKIIYVVNIPLLGTGKTDYVSVKLLVEQNEN